MHASQRKCRVHLTTASSEQNKNVSLEESQQGEQDAITLGRQDLGLSSLRIHKLHLQAGRHPTPVAPLGLHLVLNGANLK